jgi:hypothetical protein
MAIKFFIDILRYVFASNYANFRSDPLMTPVQGVNAAVKDGHGKAQGDEKSPGFQGVSSYRRLVSGNHWLTTLSKAR